MITANECQTRYGPPEKESAMVVWQVPEQLHIDAVPRKIYCNRDLVEPLTSAFTLVIARDLAYEIKTWDGCFNIRQKRGASSPSLHSWGIAVDINAAWNGFGKSPTMPVDLVLCFSDAGFDWGGMWSVPDGMHFQLRSFS